MVGQTARVRGRSRIVPLITRGGVAIAAGIAALLVSPAAGTVLLASYFIVDGGLALSLAARMSERRRVRWLLRADGIADIVVAALLAVWAPNVAMMVLIVSIWAIGTGLLEIAVAIFLPRWPALAWTIAIVGLLSCVIGVVAVDWTDLAEIGLLYLFGSYAIVAGVLFITVGVLLAHAFHIER